MSIYTCADASQNLSQLLNEVKRNVEVVISDHGESYKLIKLSDTSSSGLDVPGINADITTGELINFVRNAREKG
jgi:hypothetical protein